MHNFVSGPNLRHNVFSYVMKAEVFVEDLPIHVISIGPFFAEGNRGIENHFFVRCRSLEAGLVLQVFGCRVCNNGYKCCNHV